MGMLAFAAVNPSQVEASGAFKFTSPTVPSNGNPVIWQDSVFTLNGSLLGLSGSVTLKSLTCTTDHGQTGIATVNSYQYTSANGGTYFWTAQAPLENSLTKVTMKAVDSNNVTYAASITVSYLGGSSSGSRTFILDSRGKAKFTFYYAAGSSYTNLDRFSVVGYLSKAATDPSPLPFAEDVTISVSAHVAQTGENLLLFTQTVPKNTVTGTTKYRYLSRNKGIQELTLAQYKPTETSFYLFVDKINMLAAKRASMTPVNYLKFVRSIDSFTITFQSGEDTWVGNAPLSRGGYSTVKQEMVYNR